MTAMLPTLVAVVEVSHDYWWVTVPCSCCGGTKKLTVLNAGWREGLRAS